MDDDRPNTSCRADIREGGETLDISRAQSEVRDIYKSETRAAINLALKVLRNSVARLRRLAAT